MRSNGGVSLCDYRRPLQQLEAVQRTNGEFRTESVIHEGARENESLNLISSCINPWLAPLGIPFCPASVGAAFRKGLSFGVRVDSVSFYDKNESSDDKTMNQVVKAQGLEGVSSDCAIVLNNMLNLYMKRMIRSCVELVGVKRQLALKPHVSKKGYGWLENQDSGATVLQLI